eukprot:TRINITY_DN66413_c0_g1_i1.p1 TRINITY_DN66413_c0_g1~~TRINITY_DN66413_c0_g1_i1.p1  ORF type:complete len:246 (+),score=10.99 TRINITY_DN66413_c0_g1_i1:3-740(+)
MISSVDAGSLAESLILPGSLVHSVGLVDCTKFTSFWPWCTYDSSDWFFKAARNERGLALRICFSKPPLPVPPSPPARKKDVLHHVVELCTNRLLQPSHWLAEIGSCQDTFGATATEAHLAVAATRGAKLNMKELVRKFCRQHTDLWICDDLVQLICLYYTPTLVEPKKSEMVYLVRGIDNGRKAWYYVEVNPHQHAEFRNHLDDDIIHLEKYGSIIRSGYGEAPPEDTKRTVLGLYGVEDCDDEE